MTSTTMRPSSFQRDGLFGFLTVVLIAAIVRGALGARRTSTYVVMGLCAALLVVVLISWVRQRRRPSSLEIGPDLIRFLDPGAQTPERELRRMGGAIVVGVRRLDLRRAVVYIAQPDTGTSIDLNYYKVRPVAVACRAQGWPVTERSPGRKDRS
jgi:uncharacterized membrane protein YuzA (DUF378 family)